MGGGSNVLDEPGGLERTLRRADGRLADSLPLQNYFALVNSARFKSRFFCSITLTLRKFFLSASRKSAALPTITRLVGWPRYFLEKSVTASVVTASIDGMYLSRVSSGRS